MRRVVRRADGYEQDELSRVAQRPDDVHMRHRGYRERLRVLGSYLSGIALLRVEGMAGPRPRLHMRPHRVRSLGYGVLLLTQRVRDARLSATMRRPRPFL